jgi:hypothetical protein
VRLREERWWAFDIVDCGGLHRVLRRRVYWAALVGVRVMGAVVVVVERSQAGSAPLRAEVGMKRQKRRP